MSKRHQASRRRAYGRRQHELHQRPDHRDAALLAVLEPRADATTERLVLGSLDDRRGAGLVLGLAD